MASAPIRLRHTALLAQADEPRGRSKLAWPRALALVAGLLAASVAFADEDEPDIVTPPPADAHARENPAATPSASRVQAVTVYRGEALVTRVVEVPAGTGDVDLVVTGLPENVVPASLAARPETKGVLVRAVRFQARVAEHAPDPKIAALDSELLALA